MNKISFILFSLILLASCGNEIEQTEENELTQKEQFEKVNIDALSEEELYSRSQKIEKELVDQESLEVSKKYSRLLMETAQKHIEKYPKSKNRRDVIRKGSRAAQGLNQDYEAIRMLALSIKENANDSSIIEEMNVRAFLYDKLDNKEKAKEAYEEILEKYPNHPSSKNHKARLETIHMSTEELLKYFEEKNAK